MQIKTTVVDSEGVTRVITPPKRIEKNRALISIRNCFLCYAFIKL